MDFFLIFYLFPMINDFQISVDNAVIVFAIKKKPRFHQEMLVINIRLYQKYYLQFYNFRQEKKNENYIRRINLKKKWIFLTFDFVRIIEYLLIFH